MIEHFDRALNSSERRELEARLAVWEWFPRASLAKTAVASFAVCGVLGLLTLAASDAPQPMVVLFWTLAAIGFTIWMGITGSQEAHRQTARLRDALVQNRARGVRVKSDRVVEFDEIEDEGACYAFAVDEERVIFVLGQEFYANESFPNDDFSIVDVLSSSNLVADTLIVTDGHKLEPGRIIPSATKDALEIPDHLQVVSGRIEDIERLLPQRSTTPRHRR